MGGYWSGARPDVWTMPAKLIIENPSPPSRRSSWLIARQRDETTAAADVNAGFAGVSSVDSTPGSAPPMLCMLDREGFNIPGVVVCQPDERLLYRQLRRLRGSGSKFTKSSNDGRNESDG